MRRYLWTVALTLSAFPVPINAQAPNPDQSLTGSVVTFDPTHQKPIFYSDESVQVTLIVGREQDSIKILTRGTGKEMIVQLPDEIAQVDEIRKVVSNRLVVRGMVNGSGSEVVVIDLLSAKLVDKFLCYQPAISPDGHYIAFIKFYPAHFAEGTEDHYMLYDLDINAKENRPKGVAADDWETVGRSIYPVGIANKNFDNLRRPEGSEHLSKSRFFWNTDGALLVFADQVTSSPELDVVLAIVSKDGKITIKTLQQHESDICGSATNAVQRCPLLLRKVEFHSQPLPSIITVFEIVDTQKLKTIQFEFSKFQLRADDYHGRNIIRLSPTPDPSGSR